MIIFVRVESSKRITLEVEPSDQIEYVKAKIKKVEAVSFDNKQLRFGGRVLENSRSLQSYDIGSEAVLDLS